MKRWVVSGLHSCILSRGSLINERGNMYTGKEMFREVVRILGFAGAGFLAMHAAFIAVLQPRPSLLVSFFIALLLASMVRASTDEEIDRARIACLMYLSVGCFVRTGLEFVH